MVTPLEIEGLTTEQRARRLIELQQMRYAIEREFRIAMRDAVSEIKLEIDIIVMHMGMPRRG